MPLLISFNDIKALKPISNNIDIPKKVDLAIQDAQEFDIRPLIGESFYLAIVANPSAYADLLNGVSYTISGDEYESPGVKKCLALFAYARIKNDANDHDTAYGTMNKNNPYSTGVSEATKVRQLKEIRDQAQYYWKRIEMYLNEKSNDYPLWENSICCRKNGYSSRSNGFRKIYGTK
jgi:hypothetical protein